MTVEAPLLAEVCAALRAAERILVITGAGLSADSGLPTYRGLGGLYNGVTEEGLPIEEALSGAMLRSRPALCWKYMHQIGDACRGAGPNEGHRVLARWQDRFQHVTVLTQNVDGFHVQAGSRDVIEIHGNLGVLHCTRCSWRTLDPEGQVRQAVPRCPDCGALARPEVVLFGEMLPDRAVLRYQVALETGFDLVLSVGTTSVFPYIAGPVAMARRQGLPTVEINPGDTEVSHLVRWRLRSGAAETLLALERALAAGDPA